jgi:hypothetical protein
MRGIGGDRQAAYVPDLIPSSDVAMYEKAGLGYGSADPGPARSLAVPGHRADRARRSLKARSTTRRGRIEVRGRLRLTHRRIR